MATNIKTVQVFKKEIEDVLHIPQETYVSSALKSGSFFLHSVKALLITGIFVCTLF